MTFAGVASLFPLLEWLSPAACAVSMAALVVAGVAGRGELLRNLLERRGWAWLAVVIALPLAVRLATVPATERVYYDEHTYLQIARGIADEARAQVATYGLIQQQRYRCLSGSDPHWSLGWPVLLAGGLRVTGYARWTGAAVNLALSLATVLLVALLAAALFPGTRVWLAAAATFACLPANQIWSRTSASEVFAAFAATLAVLCAVRFRQAPSRRLGWLLAAALATGAQTRNEMIWLLPVCALFLGRRALREALWPAVLTIALLLPQGLHLGSVARAYDPNLVAGSGFGTQYVSSNLASVVQYVRGEWIALGCVLLAVLASTRARLGKVALPVWLWGLSALLAPMIHFGGSYVFPGGERFALAWLPPLALAAGCGLYALHYTLPRHLPGRLLMALWAALFAGVLLRAGPWAAVKDRETAVPRGDMAFLRAALTAVPQDGLVISSDPSAVIAEGRSSVFLPWTSWEPDRLAKLAAQYPRNLYYFVSPSSAPGQWAGGPDYEPRLLSFFRAVPVAREQSPAGTRVLYRLTPPSQFGYQ